jgi:hypothetical protein
MMMSMPTKDMWRYALIGGFVGAAVGLIGHIAADALWQTRIHAGILEGICAGIGAGLGTGFGGRDDADENSQS